jgi:hypothetical protein
VSKWMLVSVKKRWGVGLYNLNGCIRTINYNNKTYGAHSQCPVRICAVVLASRFEARSKKNFFDAGGVIDSFPLSISDSL